MTAELTRQDFLGAVEGFVRAGLSYNDLFGRLLTIEFVTADIRAGRLVPSAGYAERVERERAVADGRQSKLEQMALDIAEKYRRKR
jgi:hypothetical protein